jgi:hypothetical protein
LKNSIALPVKGWSFSELESCGGIEQSWQPFGGKYFSDSRSFFKYKTAIGLKIKVNGSKS